jgi:uncharacterized coiled-coil DUF342 family protein
VDDADLRDEQELIDDLSQVIHILGDAAQRRDKPEEWWQQQRQAIEPLRRRVHELREQHIG